MFYRTKSFNQPLNEWDVSNVISMNGMFFETTTFNGDISEWDVSSVMNMEAMFGRMQDEFDSTIPRATEMIVDKIIESGVGGGGGILPCSPNAFNEDADDVAVFLAALLMLLVPKGP